MKLAMTTVTCVVLMLLGAPAATADDADGPLDVREDSAGQQVQPGDLGEAGSTKAAGSCSDWTRMVATPLKWSPASVNTSCNVAGHAGYKKPYTFAVAADVSACAQGRGYTGSLSNTKTEWRSLGCGKGGSATVPWGNRLGHPAVRGLSQSGVTGAAMSWR